MTSIPRESVPSLPRPEVSERPLLEGGSGYRGAGFEDFLFPLADPPAQALAKSRSKPQPPSTSRSTESRQSDSKAAVRSEKPDETRDDESRADEDSGVVSKSEARRPREQDENLLLEELATDPSLIAAVWPAISVEPEVLPVAIEEQSEGLADGVATAVAPTVAWPVQAAAAEANAVTAETMSSALEEAAPVDAAQPQGTDAKPLAAELLAGQAAEATSASATSPQLEASASPVRSLEHQVFEMAESVAPADSETKAAAASVTAAGSLRAASPIVASTAPEAIEPDGEASEEDSSGERSLRSPGLVPLTDLTPLPFAEALSEIPSTETLVPESGSSLTAATEMPVTQARDSQAMSANPSTLNAMAAPTTQAPPAASSPTPPPAPSMATPPSRWLQGGEYRRFLHRMDRAFELAGQRGGEIRLRLSPPRLGSIRLEMSMNDERMVARIETDSEETRQILLEQFPVLRERLAERGVAVESFQVETRREGDSAPSDQRDDSRQRRLRREDDRDVASASARGTGPIICRLPMSGNHLTGLDVIV